MNQTTPSYTQLGQDGGKKTTWALGFLWRWRGWGKNGTFHSEVTVSLFQVMDVWRQKSVWELRFANSPLWAWEQLPPAEGCARNSLPTSKLSLTQIVPLQPTGLLMWAQCDPGALFSLSIIKGYSVVTHRTKLIFLSHWWTATTDPAALPVASEHPRARGIQPWADVILLPGTLPQLLLILVDKRRGSSTLFKIFPSSWT